MTGSHDLTARIWDASNGQHLVTLQGHSEQVRKAGFSPDGTMIVTASDDRGARLWDAANGQQLAVLDGHTDWVLSAAFGPDGSKIVTASSDRTAKVWGCTVREMRRVLVARQGRIRIPAEFRTALGIEAGDLVVVELGEDMLYLRPARLAGGWSDLKQNGHRPGPPSDLSRGDHQKGREEVWASAGIIATSALEQTDGTDVCSQRALEFNELVQRVTAFR